MPSGSALERAAVVLHGRPEALGAGLARLELVAKEKGVELAVVDADSVVEPGSSDVAIVLGGDGTMLRALQLFLGTGIPVIGVNFGRVGFLSAIPRDELERGVARVFEGELEVVELSTLDVEAGGERFVAVNDAVVTSGELGRMVELEWSVGGEDFGRVPCDGLDLLDAVRIDGVQPVERWSGPDVGCRRDGVDVRRSPRSEGEAVRRSPRARPARVEPDSRCRLHGARRRAPGRGCRPGGARFDPPRGATLAARHPVGRDVRAPLPAELRPVEL